MRYGKFDRKVIIQRATEGQDEIGGVTQTWADHLTVWAQVIPVTGRESLEFEQLQSSATIRLFTHFVDVTEKDRLSYEGAHWNIRYVREIGRQAGTEIVAERVG